jgi:serine/threonine protein kinase
VGLVHRDIKPGNIVVTADGPQVLDFGIARWPDAETYLLGMGTPADSSPEQFTATADSLGSPSDLYSLASTLTFAASGRPPYAGNSALAIIDSVRSGPPDLTSLPEALRQLIAPCVESRPRDRPTAEQLLAGLEELIGDEEESPLSVSQARYVAEFAAKRQPAARPATTRVRKPSWTTRTGEIDLDRVLRGEADESFVAAQGSGETEKDQVVAGIAPVARAETAVARQPGHRPLDDPAVAAQSFAGLDSLTRDPYSDAFAA